MITVSSSSHRRALVGFGLALLALLTLLRPVNAWAADDMIDSWTAIYTVKPSGVVHVEETLVYRFGDNSGRHGIDRTLVIREPWGSSGDDAVYTISNIAVTSTGPSNRFTTSTLGSGRNKQMRIRIGSPNMTVRTQTANYTLTYDISGALRHTNAVDDVYDELYWNAIGAATPMVTKARITVVVPGGVRDVRCYTGPAGSTTPCTGASIGPDGVATFTQSGKEPGSFLTIATRIAPGLVADNQPHLMGRSWDALTSWLRVIGVMLVTGVLTAIGARWFSRRIPRDERYLNVAPGTVDMSSEGPDNHPIIPVQFLPPAISVAEAGVIDDGRIEVCDMTATLLSLAVRGVVRLSEQKVRVSRWKVKRAAVVTLLSRDHPMTVTEAGLVKGLFDTSKPGCQQLLVDDDFVARLYIRFITNTRREVRGRFWFKPTPKGAAAKAIRRPISLEAVPFVVIGACVVSMVAYGATSDWFGSDRVMSFLTAWWPALVCPIIVAIGYIWYRSRPQRPPRTALGRAYADQVAGFRKYLATAEADQIQFEEGQDIFSEYLPWAVIFGLTKRWTKICKQLVAQGRLPGLSADWYDGNLKSIRSSAMMRSLSSINGITDSFDPSSGSSSGSTSFGSGGGSAFSSGGSDGGGSSGGGGGGGGASSW